MRAFTKIAWTVLAWNLGVVVWGAFVRATGSGAGCGAHWPLCNGVAVPRAPALATAIEFTHRATSGLALLSVVVLVVAAVAAFPRGHAARAAAWTSLALMLVEAALGAGLVLFGWVANDASPARGWVMAIHLTNTFLLLGALTLAGAFAARPSGLVLRGRGSLAAVFLVGVASMILAGATGAVAALGDTLFPSVSFADGLRQELDSGAHVLLRLRVLHPFAAVGSAIVLSLCARSALRARADETVRVRAVTLLALVGVEVVAGAFNVVLLAPVWLQLLHLLLADLIWIALLLLAAEAFAPAARPVPLPAPVAAPVARPG
jgi:heme a synthase